MQQVSFILDRDIFTITFQDNTLTIFTNSFRKLTATLTGNPYIPIRNSVFECARNIAPRCLFELIKKYLDSDDGRIWANFSDSCLSFIWYNPICANDEEIIGIFLKEVEMPIEFPILIGAAVKMVTVVLQDKTVGVSVNTHEVKLVENNGCLNAEGKLESATKYTALGLFSEFNEYVGDNLKMLSDTQISNGKLYITCRVSRGMFKLILSEL